MSSAILALKENGYDINTLVDRFRLTTKLLGWTETTIKLKGSTGVYTYKAQLYNQMNLTSFTIKATDTDGKEYHVL